MKIPFKNAKVFRIGALPDEYLADPEQRGSPRLQVRPHVLGEVLRNPRRWRNGYESPESKSKDFGELLDCLALTPNQWPKRFCCTPDSYVRDGEKKAWRNDKRIPEVAKWLEDHTGLKVVSDDTNASVHAALKVLQADDQIAGILASGRSQVWVIGQYEDTATGLVVPVKCLIDKVPDLTDPVLGDYLCDLKTCRNASPRRFARDCYDYHYDLQAAFDLDLYEAATGEGRSHWLHIVQENYPPYELRTPPPVLGEEFVERGRWLYRQALELYCRCATSGHWPGYDRVGTWPVTKPEEWMLSLENVYTPEIQEPEEDEEPAEVTP